MLRSIGAAFAHCAVAYASTAKGISKLDADAPAMARDLAAHWEVLAEPIQTVMRRHGSPRPYEQLKELTRGQAQGAFGQQHVTDFVAGLEKRGELPPEAARRLAALTPATYTGLAAPLARAVRAEIKNATGFVV